MSELPSDLVPVTARLRVPAGSESNAKMLIEQALGDVSAAVSGTLECVFSREDVQAGLASDLPSEKIGDLFPEHSPLSVCAIREIDDPATPDDGVVW